MYDCIVKKKMIFVIGVSWNGNNLLYISFAVMVDDGGGEVKGEEVPSFETHGSRTPQCQ